MKMHAVAAIAAVVLIGITGSAIAVDDPLKTRQEQMKSIGSSMKLLGQMAKGEVGYEADKAEAAVQKINMSIKGFTDHFPAGSDTGETEASPKIWTDMEAFKKIADNLEMAAAAAVPAAGQGLDAMRGSLGSIGKNCKECHEGYRIKKK